jgi:hypothetical protein
MNDMKIKRINEFNEIEVRNSKDILTKQYPEYLLIIGKSSDVFDYFGVDELHGLKKSECYDGEDSAYIAGLCNQFPDDSSKQFLFINQIRIGRSYKDVLLIMHEAMHLSLEINGLNLQDGDLEEKVITYAENTAIEICEYLKSLGILKLS